jgi:hypothetical protein
MECAPLQRHCAAADTAGRKCVKVKQKLVVRMGMFQGYEN